MPHATGDDATWTPIETITHAAYAGPVYSLEVERFHHYVADGIVTHNCFYGWVKGHRPPFYGQRNQTTVWEMGNETSPAAREHPTQKPVRLFEIPMENHTKGGEVCYEPFSGSGSQIIAGEKLGRRVFAIEIDPRYVDVAVQRWETYTSKRARKLAG